MSDGQQLGRLLLIKIGDGGSPTEQFTNLCGIKTRRFNMSANEVDTTIPSCTNPGDKVQKTSRAGIQNMTFSGDGNFVKSANMTAFMAHVRLATSFNAQVVVPGDGTYQGSWFVTNFEFGGDMEPDMTFSATFAAADQTTFTAEP